MKKTIAHLELCLASKSPILEAEYAIVAEEDMDLDSAFRFYNPLVAKIKEHRKIQITKNDDFQIDDFKEKLRLKHLEEKLMEKELPKLKEENKMLRQKIE